MQRGHYDVEQRHKTAIKQLQYRYRKNFGRCNNLTMRLWANSGSSLVHTAKVIRRKPERLPLFISDTCFACPCRFSVRAGAVRFRRSCLCPASFAAA